MTLVFVLPALTMMSWGAFEIDGAHQTLSPGGSFPRHVDNTQCCAGVLCINTAHQSKTPGGIDLRDAANTHDAVPGAWALM